MSRTHFFTSEAVTPGHPDKTADLISDTILDEILRRDPLARVAAETFLAKGLVVVAGEINTEAYVDVERTVRRTILDIGYDNAAYGLDGNSVGVLNAIIAQSPEIADLVANSVEAQHGSIDILDQQGAGDQGIMFGYANTDNDDYFPAPLKLAHLLGEQLTIARQHGSAGILLPDGKTQVTLRYEDGYPVAVDTVVISAQHTNTVSLPALRAHVQHEIIQPVLTRYNEEHAYRQLDISGYRTLVNVGGTFHLGSSAADTGLTGRKIVNDTYGGISAHGGGAFSGKDPSKVDRSGAYAMRWVAKNLVAAGAAEELELQVSYVIGQAQPVSFHLNTRGKTSVGHEKLEGIVREVFDLRPAAIIKDLDLRRPIYAETAKHGHFGRNLLDFTWEQLDKVEEIKALL